MVLNKLRRGRMFRVFERDETGRTVELSEQLLCRFSNDPELTKAVIALHLDYIELLRKNGNFMSARKCFNRLLSVLEVLFYNPEVSDIARENLIELQFRRGRELQQRPGQAELLSKIAKELEIYQGIRKKEFQKKYADLLQSQE